MANFFDQFDPTPQPDTAAAPQSEPQGLRSIHDEQGRWIGYERVGSGTGEQPAAPQQTTPPPPTKQQGNYFDQFDSHPAPQPSTAADIRQGTGRGLIESTGMVLGMPSDIWHMIDRGYQWALTSGAEKMGLLSPEQGAALREPMTNQKGENLEEPSLSSDVINRHLLKVAKSAGADVTPPKAAIGQAAETMASFLPAGAALGATSAAEVPRALLRYGAIPAASSEAAGQATSGTWMEPYARIAGAVGPEALVGAYQHATHALNPVNAGLANLQPADAAAAQVLLDQSRQAGAPLTVAQAIQKVTGPNRMGDIERVVEQSPGGGQIMKEFHAQRPGQVEQLGRTTFDQIAPPITDPYEIAPRVQDASQSGVTEAHQARTAQTEPFYTAANTDQVPADEMEAFLSRLDQMIARDKTGVVSPELERLRDALVEQPATPGTPAIPAQRVATQTPTGATIYRPGQPTAAVPGKPRVPVTDIENLDNARKYFRDRLALPLTAQDAIPKLAGARMSSVLKDLRDLMETHSPDFAAGRSLHEQITRDIVGPLERSPTGQLAAAETYPKQAAILFNPRPMAGSEKAMAAAVRQVASQDPMAARQLVRQYVENVFNEATQHNLPGPNQFGGPKFAAIIAGNSQQAKNLEAIFKALPQGDLRWNAFRKSLDILEGMGMRQPVGSQTTFNAQIREWLSKGNLPADFVASAASPHRWLSLAHDIYEHIAYRKNTARLASIFTEGNVSDLQALATAPPRSIRGQAAMIGALARMGASEPTQQP